MKFSIVIPVYNKAPFVGETLQSLVDQTKLPDEIIIVDDRSSDNSLQKVREFFADRPTVSKTVRIKIIELKENRGVGYARNRGFSETSGDLIMFLDADDLFAPDLIQTVEDLISLQPIDLLVLGIEFFPSNTVYPKLEKISRFLSPFTSEAFLMEEPLKIVSSPDFFMGASNVIAKKKWLETTRFCENVLLFEGIDYWYRVLKIVLRKSDTNVGLLTGNYLKVREVPGSLSRQKYDKWDQIEIPPILQRYRKSKQTEDKLLMGVIGSRWLRHALKSLTSNKQRLIFILKYRTLFLRQLYYFVLRRIRSG